MALLVGVVVVLAVVVIYFVFMSGPSAPAADQPGEPPAPVRSEEPRRVTPSRASAGTPPDRPAPAIPALVWDDADDLYRRAADLWNEGQDARRAGNTAEYQAAVLDSWGVLKELYSGIEPYTDWFEEADLEGWAMPADYDRLQQQLGVWDSLRTKVRKMKPAKRR